MDSDLVATLRAAGCVFAEQEAIELELAADGDPLRLSELAQRRVAGEPLEHVVGSALFDGHRVAVTRGVFVPRQRSVLLVEMAAAALPEHGLLVDIGCGSGALGRAVALRRRGTRLHAVDNDPAAVACARTNLAGPLLGDAQVHHGDLTDPLPPELRGEVDVIIANLPYVPSAARAAMPAESRDHEPAASTDGGADGLDHVRRLAARARTWLRPGGMVVVETGGAATGQDRRAAAVFRDVGLEPTTVEDGERGACAVRAVRPR